MTAAEKALDTARIHSPWPADERQRARLANIACHQGATLEIAPDNFSRRHTFNDGSSVAIGPGGTWSTSANRRKPAPFPYADGVPTPPRRGVL